MSQYTLDLIDPSAEKVVEFLAVAVKQGNLRAKLGRLTVAPAELRAAAEACVRLPEGARRWVDVTAAAQFLAGTMPTTLAGLAWWVSPLGKRHVRIAGRRAERDCDHAGGLFGPRNVERLPLWLLYPDRMFLRTRNGERELIALCACGAAGPPASLGWVGECCGPCHDREEEGAPAPSLPFADTGTREHHDSAVHALGLSLDGQMLVSFSGAPLGKNRGSDGLLSFSDVRTCQVATADSPPVGAPGDRAMLACGGKRMFDGCGMQLWEITGAPVKGAMTAVPTERVVCVALSRNDKLLARGLMGRTVRVDDISKWPKAKEVRTFSATACSLAFAPDGQKLAVGALSNWVHLFDVAGEGARHLRVDVKQAVRALAFDPEGHRIVAGTGPSPYREVRALPGVVAGQVLLWDLSSPSPRGTTLQTHDGAVLAVAFTPDGRYLASAGADRAVKFWDLQANREAGALEWHVGAVNALAFTPDGETLVTGSDDWLVKLCPWRLLLS
jgi:hypothetical protein